MAAVDIGIDLGTSTTLFYLNGKGVVLQEPSVVAVDTRTGKLIAAGKDAYQMLGRTHRGIKAAFPLSEGVISDFDLTAQMITEFLKKVCGNRIVKPRVVVCMPSSVTEVERRALEDAIVSAGARKVCPIEEPVAAAIGAGIDIAAPHGCMVVDIGGGTTDVAVISLNGISVTESIKTAGNDFDEAIIRYLRRRYSILIGGRMAEKLKMSVGCVWPPEEKRTDTAKGRNLLTGLPQSITVSTDDMLEALEEPAQMILSAIQRVLETTPPELIGDIFTDGIVLTGGGGLIDGLDKLITSKTGVACRIPEDAVSCVARGTGMSVKYIDVLSNQDYRMRNRMSKE